MSRCKMSGVIKSGDMNGYSQLKISSFKNIIVEYSELLGKKIKTLPVVCGAFQIDC
jgi:hypothetical protein